MQNKKHVWVSVDVEADGPCPGLFSMVCFGAVVIEPPLNRTFYGKTSPITERYVQDALSVSGFSREEHEKFPDPESTMLDFNSWCVSLCADRLVFVTDNLAFDWQFINYYFHKYIGKNPFGFSGRRIGDIYAGLHFDSSTQNEWKKLYRKTPHTHNPVDDAKGNAEAMLALKDSWSFKF